MPRTPRTINIDSTIGFADERAGIWRKFESDLAYRVGTRWDERRETRQLVTRPLLQQSSDLVIYLESGRE